MPQDTEIKLAQLPNERVNALSASHIIERQYDSGAKHIYIKDAYGNEHHSSHDTLLGAYGHIALPKNIVKKIKSLDDPTIPNAQKDQIRDSLAAWQETQTQNWHNQNTAYNPDDPNYTPATLPNAPNNQPNSYNHNPNTNQNPNHNQDPNIASMLQTMSDMMQQNQQLINLLQQILANQNPQNPNQPPQNPNQPPQNPQNPNIPPQAPQNPNQPHNDPNQTPNHNSPEQQAVTDAEAALQDARRELLEITIRRKARSFDRGSDRSDYNNALAIYNGCLRNLLAARTALEVANAQAPPSEADLARREMREAFAEQRQFVDLEHQMGEEAIDNGGWRGKFLRRYARLSTKKKLALGLVVGGGVALTSGALGLGLAGLAAGSAARFSLVLLNKKASIRNVSEHSRDQMRAAIDRGRRELDALAAAGHNLVQQAGFTNLDEYREQGLLTRIENDYQGNVQSAQRKQRMGAAIVGASAALMLVGVGGELGALPNPHLDVLPKFNMPNLPFEKYLPHFLQHHSGNPNSTGLTHTTGGPIPGGTSDGGSHNFHLPGSFKPNTFVGLNGDDAVRHALYGGDGFKSVFESNGIHVGHASADQIHQISLELARQHVPMASGINADGSQHIVNWATGNTINSGASAQEGFKIVGSRGSWDGWDKLAQIAHSKGVAFSGKGLSR